MPTVERLIEVRGDAAVLIERKIVKAVSVDSLRRALTTADIQTPIMPPAIFYSRSGNKTTIAVVRDKCRRKVQFLNEEPVEIFIPTRVYFLHLLDNTVMEKIQQFFCRTIPGKMSDVLLQAPFPNKYEDGAICDAGLHLMYRDATMAERLDNAVEQVENTRYNNDLAGIGMTLAPDEFTAEMGDTVGYKNMLIAWGRLSQAKTDEEMLALSWQEAGKFEVYTQGYRRRR